MKGISPMLATILLVAFTVAIGGIISVWFSSFTRTTTANVESASVNQTKCAGTYIDISSVTASSFVIVNRGDQNVTNINCFTSDGTSVSPTINYLDPGMSKAVLITRAANTSVFCSGRCLSVGVTGECRNTQGCWSS